MADSLEVVERSEISQAEWDRVAEHSPDAGPWALWDWQQIISAVPRWGLRELSFALREPSGRIVCVVPLHHIAAEFRVACSGFGLTSPTVLADVGSADRARILKLAFAEMARRGEQAGARKLQVGLDVTCKTARESAHGVNPLLEHGAMDESTHILLLDLSLSEDSLRMQMSQDARQQTKRALSEGYSARRVAWPSMLDEYYRVHVETYNRTGVMPHPREYFAGIAQHRGNNGRAVLWAGFSPDGRVVAFHNDVRTHGVSRYHTGCCETHALRTGINYLLFWAAIIGAKNDGCRWYDIGEVFPGVENGKERGLSVFKSKFGGEMYRSFRGSVTLNGNATTAIAEPEAPGALREWLRATHRLTEVIVGERTASLAKAAAARGYKGLRSAAALARAVTRENRLLVTGRIPFMQPLWDAAEDAAVAGGADVSIHAPLEDAFRSAARISADSAVAVTSSGRTALGAALSILAAKNPERRRVLVPSYSCRGLFDPIVRLGLSPEFVEVDEDLLPDAVDTIARMRPDVLAYIAVHLSGCRMDMTAVDAAARRQGVAVIEDCCHYLGGAPSSDADFQIFSFGIGKTIMATAGGALVSGRYAADVRASVARMQRDDSRVAVRRYRHFRSTFFRPRGLPPKPIERALVTQFGDFLISDLDAQLCLIQLGKLPEILEGRRRHATKLRNVLSRFGDVVRLQHDREHMCTKLSVRFARQSDADRFAQLMNEKGVELEPMYVPLHLRDFATSHATRRLPFTESLRGCVWNVPIRPNLKPREVSRITRSIESFVAARG